MSEPVMLKCNHCEAEFLSIYEHECSYEKLKVDNARLREENARLRQQYENTGATMNRMQARSLHEENARLLKVLDRDKEKGPLIQTSNYVGPEFSVVLDYIEENKRLRDALAFYADEKNYAVTGEKFYIGHGDYIEDTWIEVDRDRGKIAKTALEGE